MGVLGRGREERCSCRNPCRGFPQRQPVMETAVLLGFIAAGPGVVRAE